MRINFMSTQMHTLWHFPTHTQCQCHLVYTLGIHCIVHCAYTVQTKVVLLEREILHSLYLCTHGTS